MAEDTRQKAKALVRYLAREEDYEVDSINQEDEDEDVFEVNNYDREYLVLRDDDDDKIHNRVQYYLENAIEDNSFTGTFNSYFIDNILSYVDDYEWESIVEEEIRYKYEDSLDDSDLPDCADQLGLDINDYYIYPTDDEDDDDDEDDEDEVTWDNVDPDDLDLDQLREDLIYKEMEEARYDGYLNYLWDNCDSSIIYEALDENWEDWIAMDDIVDEYMENEDWYFILAPYDGEQIDIGGDYYAYRVN